MKWIKVEWKRDENDYIDLYFNQENYELLGKVIQPGNVVRFIDGMVDLIGSVNTNLGRCDCCCLNRKEDIEAYACAMEWPISLQENEQ